MKAMLFAVLLTVMQAASQVPREAADVPTGGSQTVEKNSSGKQPPTTPSFVPNAGSPANDQHESSPPPNGNSQQIIVVRELPPVTVTTDWWSKLYVIFTGALMIVGGFGVLFALRTLRAIESQTRVLTEGQRPRIVANPHGDPSKTLADPYAPRMELEVINKGRMPATDFRYQSWIEVLPFPFEDFTAAADHFKFDITSVLYPDTPQVINIPIRGGITPEEFTEVKRLREHVCVRLYVEYADPFIANRRCYVNFGFYAQPRGLGFLEKYNGLGYEDKKA